MSEVRGNSSIRRLVQKNFRVCAIAAGEKVGRLKIAPKVKRGK